MVELASGDLWHSRGDIGLHKASPFSDCISNTLITRGYTALNLHCVKMMDCLAGTVGLEPTICATKKRCPTIRPRPKLGVIYAEKFGFASQKSHQCIACAKFAFALSGGHETL